MFVLIHSPLVGTLTWRPVAEEMRRRGIAVMVPALQDNPASSLPYWKQEVEAVANALRDVPPDEAQVLVAHSGAGPLLPAIRAALGRTVQGYIFVDAGMPKSGASRLELMAEEDAAWAKEFEAYLERGERFPHWDEETLAEVVPDARVRRALVNDLKPRGAAFFHERLAEYATFPDAPCAVLQFTPTYEATTRYGQAQGWVCRKMDAGHFEMLVRPKQVADELEELAQGMMNGQ